MCENDWMSLKYVWGGREVSWDVAERETGEEGRQSPVTLKEHLPLTISRKYVCQSGQLEEKLAAQIESKRLARLETRRIRGRQEKSRDIHNIALKIERSKKQKQSATGNATSQTSIASTMNH